MIFRFKKPSYKLPVSMVALLFCLCASSEAVYANRALALFKNMSNASLVVADEPGYNMHEDKPMVPASTLKVLTALLAFKTWSPEHRFETDFYVDKHQFLWVKGKGDPFLISEELTVIARNLKKRGLTHLNGITVDTEYFSPNIHIDGKSHTLQPYDAPAGALAANFNTVKVVRNGQKVASGESQTPLTPLMQKLGKKIPNGYHRINIGEQSLSAPYFAEVLRAKLQQQGIETANVIVTGELNTTKEPFYRHQNTHTLTDVVAEMLEHSNNFVANQLFLMMGAERYGAPANITKGQQAMTEKINELFDWDNTVFYEGSGLSYKNHLSANQFIQVLEQFAPYKSLLKSQGRSILAKTGTLTGVSSYAGYLHKANGWVPFALFINQPVPGSFRKQLAQELLGARSERKTVTQSRKKTKRMPPLPDLFG